MMPYANEPLKAKGEWSSVLTVTYESIVSNEQLTCEDYSISIYIWIKIYFFIGAEVKSHF